ncbi:MAG: hypothetical protein R3E95_19465 [Thiolinea sp.]
MLKWPKRVGVTTVTDLYNPLTDAGVAALREVSADPAFPVRLVPAMAALAWSPEAGIERLRHCRGITTTSCISAR